MDLEELRTECLTCEDLYKTLDAVPGELAEPDRRPIQGAEGVQALVVDGGHRFHVRTGLQRKGVFRTGQRPVRK